MTPGQVRARILADHVAIRGMLLSLEHVAQQVREGNLGFVGALRLEGEMLLSRLEEHMRWEDRHLAPALRGSEPDGQALATQLDSDHREQRQVLGYCLTAVKDESRPVPVVARTMIDLIEMLRDDIEHEERDLLDVLALRDGAVAVDGESR